LTIRNIALPDRALHITHESHGCVLALYGDILLACWGTSTRTEHLQPLREASEEISRRYRAASSLHVIAGKVQMPDRAAREGVGNLSKQFAANSVAACVAIIGQGFWASAMRSVITGYRWVGGTSNEIRLHICGSVEDAAQWLAPVHSSASGRPLSMTALRDTAVALCDRPSIAQAVRRG
jgi:hypothetical protein